MTKNPKLLVSFYFARVVVLLLLSGIVAAKGKNWLGLFGIHVSDKTYFWLGYLLVSLILILAMPKLLKSLRELNLQKQQIRIQKNTVVSISDDNTAAYRYPLCSVLLVVAVAAVFMLPLAISHNYTLPVYLMILVFVSIILLYAAYLFVYAVQIDEKHVIIHGFLTKKFLLDEIQAVELKKYKGSLYAIVKLTDGRKYTFDNRIKNFNMLVEELKKHCSQC